MAHDKPSKEQVRTVVRNYLSEGFTRSCNLGATPNELDQLHHLLVLAAQAYRTGPKQQRQAVADAVIATSEFLHAQGFSRDTLVPLTRVVRAITEVCEQNLPDPLFCEKPRRAKPRRGMADAVRQGQLAAIADAWLTSHADDEGDEAAKLERAARLMSGKYFGTLHGTLLRSARSYQRQTGQHPLVYQTYEQVSEGLSLEAGSAGGGSHGLRLAIEIEIAALNESANLRQP